MSEHTLPPNSAEWPKDPYQFLGVRPGVSARDLRRAYLQLIRRDKPEHAPKEFRLIREAYEVLERQARFFQLHASEIEVSEPQEDEEPVTSSRTPRAESDEDTSSPQPTSETVPADTSRTPRSREEDPWDLAIQGETERAYGQLVEHHERFPDRAETYLQLYWMPVIEPRLGPARTPWDWLIRGLLATEGESGPLRKLLRREIAAKPALAVGEDAARLLGPEMRPNFLLEFAALRWQTARHLLMWQIIRDDIDALRDRSSAAWDEIYPRLLITAASQLIWDLDGAPSVIADLVRQAEQQSHFQKSIADELWRIDFGAELVKGWRASRRSYGLGALLHRLIPLTWGRRLSPNLQISSRRSWRKWRTSPRRPWRSSIACARSRPW
jgi:curved DNA-binding protein CbpA